MRRPGLVSDLRERSVFPHSGPMSTVVFINGMCYAGVQSFYSSLSQHFYHEAYKVPLSASFEMTAQILPIILFWGVTCLLICIWQTILRFLVCSRPDCGKSSFQCAFAFGWFTFLLRVCMPKPIKDIHLWIIG